jgi:hypothetical protein
MKYFTFSISAHLLYEMRQEYSSVHHLAKILPICEDLASYGSMSESKLNENKSQ